TRLERTRMLKQFQLENYARALQAKVGPFHLDDWRPAYVWPDHLLDCRNIFPINAGIHRHKFPIIVTIGARFGEPRTVKPAVGFVQQYRLAMAILDSYFLKRSSKALRALSGRELAAGAGVELVE